MSLRTHYKNPEELFRLIDASSNPTEQLTAQIMETLKAYSLDELAQMSRPFRPFRGDRLIHAAVRSGNALLLKELIKLKLDVNVLKALGHDARNLSPLTLAAQINSLECLSALLNVMSKDDLQLPINSEALWALCTTSPQCYNPSAMTLACAELLLKAGFDPNYIDDKIIPDNKVSLLAKAIAFSLETRNYGMVSLLLKYRANPNYGGFHGYQNKEVYIPLEYCLNSKPEKNDYIVFEELLNAGADVNGLVEFVSGDVKYEVPIIIIIARKSEEAVNRLIKRGADVNVRVQLNGHLVSCVEFIDAMQVNYFGGSPPLMRAKELLINAGCKSYKMQKPKEPNKTERFLNTRTIQEYNTEQLFRLIDKGTVATRQILECLESYSSSELAQMSRPYAPGKGDTLIEAAAGIANTVLCDKLKIIIREQSAGLRIVPTAPIPLFHNMAQLVWPFDKACTQRIFSLAGVENLLSISSTSSFFRKNAIEFATNILRKNYKIDCKLIPNCLPVPLLTQVVSYYDAIKRPIEINPKDGFRSVVDSSYLVVPGRALVSICIQKNNDLCIVGSFCNRADSSSNTKDIYNYQFVSGVDSKGHVYVRRTTQEELKALISGVLHDSDLYTAFKTCKADEFNPLIEHLLSMIVAQKKTSFKELIESLPRQEGNDSLRDFLLYFVTAHLPENTSKNKKESCCQIL